MFPSSILNKIIGTATQSIGDAGILTPMAPGQRDPNSPFAGVPQAAPSFDFPQFQAFGPYARLAQRMAMFPKFGLSQLTGGNYGQ